MRPTSRIIGGMRLLSLVLLLGCAEAVVDGPGVDMLRSPPAVDPSLDMRLDLDAADPLSDAGAVDAAPVSGPDADPADVSASDRAPPGDSFIPGDAGSTDMAGACSMVPEVCNGEDEDCDGAIDEEADCGQWMARH